MIVWEKEGKYTAANYHLLCGKTRIGWVSHRKGWGWLINMPTLFSQSSVNSGNTHVQYFSKAAEARAEAERLFRAWLDRAELGIKGDRAKTDVTSGMCF